MKKGYFTVNYMPTPASVQDIAHTYYFVVRANDANGRIHRVIESQDSWFNIYMNYNTTSRQTGMYPCSWAETDHWIIDTTFQPSDAYAIIVMKMKWE